MEHNIVFLILHLFGIILGAGGAFAADYIFFQSIKDKKIGRTEMRFIKNSSNLVWFGLLLIFFSGLALFLEEPEEYLASAKFITKMIVVLIITLNGLVFHFWHIPRLKRCLNKDLRKNNIFQKKRSFFILSGVISVISWPTAIILGSLRNFSYSLGEALFYYLIILLIAFVFSERLLRKYL